MIDWAETRKIFGRSDLCGYRPRVCVRCDKCGQTRELTIRVKSDVKDSQYPWECPKCVASRPSVRNKLSDSTRQKWRDDTYRQLITSKSNDRVTRAHRDKISQSVQSSDKFRQYIDSGDCSRTIATRWQDMPYRKKLELHLKCIRNSESHHQAVRHACQAESFRQKMRDLWKDSDYRSRMSVIRSNMPRVSSLQNLLYSLLDDLDIEYYRGYEDQENDQQTVIGPYNFDCAIPRDDDTTLLIECQGDYWHSSREAMRRDRQKMSYINNNLRHLYEIRYIWEHEFKCLNRVRELLKYWTHITHDEIIDFDFDDVTIRQSCDYKDLLNKYHYLNGTGRGGMAYCAYLNDLVIAACVFSSMPRQNIQIRQHDRASVRELSRFCIHPKYQKKNFASWFMSRCIQQLSPKYKCILSYCDTTYNHYGSIYKACNFELEGKVKPDYWYVSGDGWVMHKKTLYNHARKMSMAEKEFAQVHGYQKIYGREKLRYIYERSL